MNGKKVFISYSHDSDAHREAVLAFSERLRADGIETLLDQYVNGSPPQGWPRWMLDQLDAADSVLVICTQTYYRRFRGHEEPGKGTGVDWEGGLVTQELYGSRRRTLKFVPVFLSAANEDCIPEPLRSLTHYALTSEDDYQRLYDFLLGQAGVEPRPVGMAKPKPREKGSFLSFDNPLSSDHANHALSRLPHAAEKLIGRETELKRLDDAWTDPKQYVLIIRGIGGEGKTSLVAEWANRLAQREYDGASYFDWSFYSQGTRDQTAASSDGFIAAALEFFGGEEGKSLANSPASARDKAVTLLKYTCAHRTLLVLDGLEPLQYPPGPLAGRLRDDAMAALLKGLAQRNPGLCVITTREPVADLAAFQDSTAQEWELDHLSDTAGADLLQRLLEPLKPKNVHEVRSTVEEREEISRSVQGHALTLRILGGYIHRALGDVRRWREIDYAAADAQYKTNPKDPEAHYGHAFKTIEAYERWLGSGGAQGARQLAVLRLLGLFDRPASAACLAALRAPPVIPDLTDPICGITEDEWNPTLSELEECGLVTLPKTGPLHSSSFILHHFADAHPLLREYFAGQFQRRHPEAWRAAHGRLHEHLVAATKEGDQPTLEELQPLYQAVAHGCQAGMHLEALFTHRFRIQRGVGYSTKKLAAFGSDLGAIACFCEPPWTCLPPSLTDTEQAWLLNEAAFCLRALGRLTEAVEPMRAGLEMRIQQKNWINAAASACNLSDLYLTLGEVTAAVACAEQSVTYAAGSGRMHSSMVSLAIIADALHQAGRRAEADARFHSAEALQAGCEPGYPLLYSIQGSRYCELLLAAPERAAWQRTLDSSFNAHPPSLSESCRAVSRRAEQTLLWAEANNLSLLTVAIDRLSHGRAALCEAILERSPLGPCHEILTQAVDGLRRAGDTTQIPRGLLTRAWCSFAEASVQKLTGGGPEALQSLANAQCDLDEAWEIAERGPMPLFLADIHLHRARLFHAVTPYPWVAGADGQARGPKTDLADARQLIERHGYLRRVEELEDAESAARIWPVSTE